MSKIHHKDIFYDRHRNDQKQQKNNKKTTTMATAPPALSSFPLSLSFSLLFLSPGKCTSVVVDCFFLSLSNPFLLFSMAGSFSIDGKGSISLSVGAPHVPEVSL